MIQRTQNGSFRETLKTAWRGLRLTLQHFRRGRERQAPLSVQDPGYFAQADGPVTILYPAEKVPVPDNGRYRLHLETEDCIGCDKCARICPVDCITIETFRAEGDLGTTSDGTLKRLHLPVFDIDMAKCMYCGLCTTVCPTECLTMTKVYDFSEYDRDNFLYHFGAYSPTEANRIQAEEDSARELKKQVKETPSTETTADRPRPRPMMKRPETQSESEKKLESTDVGTEKIAEESKPAFRPRPITKRVDEVSPSPETQAAPESESPTEKVVPPRPRPLFKKPSTESPPEA